MPRATHGFAFGILFVVAGWGAAVWLSRAATRTAPAPAGAPAATAAAAGHHEAGEVGQGDEGGENGAEEAASAAGGGQRPLWRIYERLLKRARYVDLTHTVTPSIPVWAGFGRSKFGPAVDPKTGRAFTYSRDGFEATRYDLATDQLGTQLDPPAHWNPDYPAIDELPPTFAVRPLVVISIVEQVARDPGYHLAVGDVLAWERRHGRIPEGSVVFVRSDWSKEWPNPALATRTRFPGVSLAALQFLHLQRKILMHGHEPLDTDTTPNLEGEAWLLRNGYTQAEGVANLDQVPEAGALVAIGYPKLGGGTGGYARYIAICPPGWKHGVAIGEVPDAPLARQARPLHWDAKAGMRIR
jgi:kynurenine formamidase